MSGPRLVVVTPVFEDKAASSALFRELRRMFGRTVHIVAVDDGSVQFPLGVQTLKDAGISGSIITLRRNVGHQRAIASGLAHVESHMPEARRIVVMDSDGEDRPDSIPVLLRALEDEHVDVAVAQRKRRVESAAFQFFYWIYRAFFLLLTGRRLNFGNFMAMNREALSRMTAMGELPTHVAGTLLLSKLRWSACLIDRGARYAGESKMNFVSLALHGFKGLMIFAEDVLVRVGAACALVASLSLIGAISAIALKAIGLSTPGWFSVALGILILVFLQTGAITLMTLLLTGVVRGASVTPPSYDLLIKSISTTDADDDER